MARLSKLNDVLPGLLAALALLTACGNRGPLYLPAEDTPPGGAAGSAPAPTVIESDFPERAAPLGAAGDREGDDEEDREEDAARNDGAAPSPPGNRPWPDP